MGQHTIEIWKKVNINHTKKTSIHFGIFGIKNRTEMQCHATYTYLIENKRNHVWLKPFETDSAKHWPETF